ncbi:MAG: OmpA family protein [Archangium sp.]|nr:OmpA family protein [Archangium sp.]
MSLAIAVLSLALAGEPLVVKGRKGDVHFPLGDISFADEVVAQDFGEKGLNEKYKRPTSDVLAKPDKKSFTLGCGGSITVRFTDNAVVDVEGADLYVFEDGPRVEATNLDLSVDGVTWVNVGRIEGGTAEVDIAGKVPTEEIYQWARLTDLKSACNAQWPGADIDALGAMGSAYRLQIGSEVLFDSGKAVLRDLSREELRALAKRISEYGKVRIRVDGHTDSQGADAFNKKLSQDRAEAVVKFLKSELEGVRIDAVGHGETRPVAPNDSDEGRQRNRRVELLVVPLR